MEKTIDPIVRTYWFPKMQAQVRDDINNCLVCITYSVPSGKIERKLHL